MLVVYRNGAVVKFVVGSGENTDNFMCSQQPNEVRVFDQDHPNGIQLAQTSNSSPAPDEWYWDEENNKVILGEVKNGKIVAYAGTVWLFTDEATPTNEENIDTIEITNPTSNYKAVDVSLTAEEIFDHPDTSADMLQFSLDGTTYSNLLNLPDIEPGGSVSVNVKFIAPDSPIVLRNLVLKLTYTMIYKE